MRSSPTTRVLSVPRHGADFGIGFAPRPGAAGHVDVVIASEPTRAKLEEAAAHLRAGELVAFPTETVYGLGAAALLPGAAEKIYEAKRRPRDNPLIVHVSDRAMLMRLLPSSYQVNAVCEVLMDAFWPGPLTLLFPVGRQGAHALVPDTVTCGLPTVGVRIPSHPVARALIALAGEPVAAPSANASGRPSPTTAAHVSTDLGACGVLQYIVDGGACDVGVESTVVDAVTTPGEVHVLRPGGVPVEALADTLAAHNLLRSAPHAAPGAVLLRVYGKTLERTDAAENTPTTPGMKYRHYSPNARVVLLRWDDSGARLQDLVHTQLHTLRHVDAATMPKDVRTRRDGHHLRIGVLCAIDSPVMAELLHGADAALAAWAADAASHGAPRLSPPVPWAGHTVCIYSLGKAADVDAAAQRLFQGLRTLDADVRWDKTAEPCDLILVEEVAETGRGLAVMNRLQKAASEVVHVRH